MIAPRNFGSFVINMLSFQFKRDIKNKDCLRFVGYPDNQRAFKTSSTLIIGLLKSISLLCLGMGVLVIRRQCPVQANASENPQANFLDSRRKRELLETSAG